MTCYYFTSYVNKLSSTNLKATFVFSTLRNKVAEAAESVGLPTFVVADAGRTQVNYRSLSFIISHT